MSTVPLWDSCPISWRSSTPPPPLPTSPPPSLGGDSCSTHSARKPGPGGRMGISCSSNSGGQKNSCAPSSKQTNPAPTGLSGITMVARPSEGPVGGQGDCALAETPSVAIIAAITAATITTRARRFTISYLLVYVAILSWRVLFTSSLEGVFSETQSVLLLILENPICRGNPIRSGPGLCTNSRTTFRSMEFSETELPIRGVLGN